jgi:hypothetical protein
VLNWFRERQKNYLTLRRQGAKILKFIFKVVLRSFAAWRLGVKFLAGGTDKDYTRGNNSSNRESNTSYIILYISRRSINHFAYFYFILHCNLIKF